MTEAAMPSKVTVLAHGCFDLVHPGHLEHLKQARQMGDCLVVSITGDKYVNKGPGRPAFPEHVRAAFLASLRCVSDVFICQSEDALPAIKRFKPHVYVKGPDYAGREDGKFQREREAVEAYGGRVAFTNGLTASSTELINSYIHPNPAFADLRARFSYSDVLGWLDKAREVTATIIGERITDIYNYVSPAWKSAKENTIDYVFEDTEMFMGGAEIVAAHAANFCKWAIWSGNQSWNITKTRYIDRAFGQKLYSVVNTRTVEPICLGDWGATICDMVIAADFGHGLFPSQQAQWTWEAIQRGELFLALTVQANGTNWGFNVYDKWPGCDYLVLDHMELRLAERSMGGDMVPLVKRAAEKMQAKYVAVTLGHNGCMVYDVANDHLCQLPVLTDKVVDRIGAGDAFLGATASLAAVGAPAEVIALVGNAAGAVKVGIQGNARAVTRSDVERVVKGVLG